MAYTPTDPLYATTWHFTALGMRGATRAIEIVWDDYRGRGVTIDTHETVESNHPDLDDQFSPVPPIDFNSHGTGVAGIIAGENNGLGGVGVAFGATLRANLDWHVSDVQNGSWVFARDYTAFQTGVAGTDWETMVEAGRGGLGTPFAKSAGNDTVIGASEGLNSSRVTATIAAVDIGGFRAGYSNYGSSILVSASDNGATAGLTGEGPDNPAGDYVTGFGGTSHASPVTAGVIALMLEANRNLGWRDVYDILAQSAYRTGSDFGSGASMTEVEGWIFNRAGNWNGGANHISGDYGYGMVDVLNAVRLAEAQALIGQAAQTSGNEQMVSSGTVSTPLNFSGDNSFAVTISGADIEIDHVAVTLNVTEADFRDLKFWLVSAEGTTILLHDGATGGLAPGEVTTYAGVAAGSGGLTYTWGVEGLRGEDVNGTWTVEVTDSSPGNRHIRSVQVDVYGGYASPDDVYVYTDEFFELKALDPARGVLNDATGDNWFNGAALSGNLVLNMAGGSASTLNGAAFIVTTAANRLTGAIATDLQDVVNGNGLDNRIYGMRGDDSLFGNNGNDLINGGRGGDLLDGGAGIDTLDYEGSSAGVRIDLSSFLDAERARGGDAEGDIIARFAALNTFENINGSGFGDVLAGDFTGNAVAGGKGADRINGLGGNDTLRGEDGSDRLIGGAGQDTVAGGSGDDVLFGDQAILFASNGHLVANNTTDNATRARALSLDGWFALTPDANVQDAAARPHVSIDGAGGGAAHYYSFFGLDGGGATFDIDLTTGGLDSWIKLYDAAGDEIAQSDDTANIDPGSATIRDSLLSYVFSAPSQTYTLAVGSYVGGVFSPVAPGQGYTLHVSLTDPLLPAQGGEDKLFGGAGNDRLYGGAGGDFLSGDNTPSVSGGGVVNSSTNENYGIDTAVSIDGLWSLAANANIADSTTVRHVTIAGLGAQAAQFFAFTVTAADIAGVNTFDIDGANFDASLRLYNADGVVLAENDAAAPDAGSAGADPRISHSFSAAGTYFIAVSRAEPGNRFAALAAGDVYQLHVSLSDPSLVFTGGDDLLKGEAGADGLYGGAGDDVLDGGADTDLLDGGYGDDILIGGAGGDTLIGGPGSDTASYAGAAARVKVALDGSIVFEGDAAGDTFSSIQRLFGTGSSDVLIGDANGNVINGGSSNDTIRGKGGGDILRGDKGADNLGGGLGDDRFSYLALDHGGDTIIDFHNVAGDNDSFQFKGSVFGGLPAGALAASRFRANTTGLAGDADDRFIYETDTGILRYDADGNGLGAAIVIATLLGAPLISSADIAII